MCAIALLITPMTLAYDIIPAPSDVIYGDGLTTNLVANFHMLPKRGKAYVKGSYTMDITKNGVMIVTYDPESRRNAMSTLAQLRDELRRNPQGIPVGKILDAPRYQWRGYMLDVSRHYMPIEDIKLIVDELAHYKFNRLHLHLTDDNGWRIEIPGYPRLKTHASHRPESYGNGIPEGGIYSRDELQNLVAYCKERAIEVIAEIDVPSHTQALALAYPEFFCETAHLDGLAPCTGIQKGVKKRYLVCPAKEPMYKFYDAVIKELVAIFPSKDIHLGGDEAPTTPWESCPSCAKQRKELSLTDAKQHMAYFLGRMAELVKANGREPLFWYELDDSLYREGETVFAWYAQCSDDAVVAA